MNKIILAIFMLIPVICTGQDIQIPDIYDNEEIQIPDLPDIIEPVQPEEKPEQLDEEIKTFDPKSLKIVDTGLKWNTMVFDDSHAEIQSTKDGQKFWGVYVAMGSADTSKSSLLKTSEKDSVNNKAFVYINKIKSKKDTENIKKDIMKDMENHTIIERIYVRSKNNTWEGFLVRSRRND